MDYLYLTLAVLFVAGTNITGKLYNQKSAMRKGAAMLYTLIAVASAFVFWLVTFMISPQYNMAVLPYAAIFSLCYVAANMGLIYALGSGAVTVTSLFGKMSLVLVAVWGFFFWNEGITVLSCMGLILCALSIFLCLYRGREGVGVNMRWIFFVCLVLFGNAGCSIVQKTQQMNFSGQYGAFMMLISTGAATLACGVAYIICRKEQSREALALFYIPVSAGLMNAGMNLLVIILATSSLSASLVYPTLASGGLIVVCISGIFIFKEKMSPRGFVGVALGLIATALLSL